MRRFLILLTSLMLILSVTARAAELACAACGMTIVEKSREHIIFHKPDSKEEVHVCSLGCAIKMRKYSTDGTIEVINFADPTQRLQASQAFFILKSNKLENELRSESQMPPFFAAFATKKEAEERRAKLGDGIIVQGFENLPK